MTTWREIERLRKSPDEFRRKADSIVRAYAEALNEWETNFLNDVVHKFAAAKEFSLRQTETLLDIKNRVTPIESLNGGFSVRVLLEKCHQARDDLSEADEEWIARLRSRSKDTIRGSEAGRLRRCAHQLNLLDSE